MIFVSQVKPQVFWLESRDNSKITVIDDASI